VGSQRSRGPRLGVEVDAAALRRARLQAGLSLAEVAGTDMTRQAVHLIETGKVRPSMRTFRVIAGRLGVPESSLLAPPAPQTDEHLIAELQRLAQAQEHEGAESRALAIIATGGSPELLAYAHHHAGRAMYALARPAEALRHLRVAREGFEAAGNHWWVAETLDWEAISLNMLQDPAAARVARRALRRYRALEPRWPETETRMLEHLGTICYGRRDYEGGRASYEAALRVQGGVRDLARIARIYHGLGMCHLGLRSLDPAADLLFKAVTLYEAEQRIALVPMRQDLPRAENDLGEVAFAQGDLERAERLFAAALEHFESMGMERLRSHTLLGMGAVRQRQGRMDEALELVTRAIERAAALDEKYALTSGYRQLGELYAARGDSALSNAAFQRALMLCQAAGLDERAREYMRVYERVLADRRQARRRSRRATA
jgi:tetratricopeptide (TPR) repeat protein